MLLNLDGVQIKYSPKAKVYEYVPNTWEILVKQRTRWLAGYVCDAPQLEMESEDKNGKSIIIARNMTMTFFGNMDTWMPLIIGLGILKLLIGEWYLLSWTVICLIFQFVSSIR